MNKKVLMIIVLIALILVISSLFIFHNNDSQLKDGTIKNPPQDKGEEKSLEQVISEFPNSVGGSFPADIFG